MCSYVWTVHMNRMRGKERIICLGCASEDKQRADSSCVSLGITALLARPLQLCSFLLEGKGKFVTTPWRSTGGVEVYLHACLTSTLEGGECSASRPARFTPREKSSSIYWTGGWLRPRACLDAVAKRKIAATAGNRTPVIRAVAQSLYWLSYLSCLTEQNIWAY
jgi:hypothetical protein